MILGSIDARELNGESSHPPGTYRKVQKTIQKCKKGSLQSIAGHTVYLKLKGMFYSQF